MVTRLASRTFSLSRLEVAFLGVDAKEGRVLTYRSVKQLLGENYKLLNRQRQLSSRHSHERHKAQKQHEPNQFKESELGQYVDSDLAPIRRNP